MGCGSEDGRPPCVLTKCLCLPLRVATVVIAVIEIIHLVGFVSFKIYQLNTPSVKYGSFLVVGDLIEALIHLGVAVVLVVGIYKERRQLLRAWIWTRSVVLITDVSTVLLASSIQAGLVAGKQPDDNDWNRSRYEGEDWKYIVFGVVIIPIYTFFIIVVRSYAIELKGKDELSPATGASSITRDQEGNEVLR